MGSRLSLAFVLFGMLVSSACSNNGRVDIRATDHNALHPGAKVEWQLIPGDDPAKQGVFDPRERQSSANRGERQEEPDPREAHRDPETDRERRRPVQPTLSLDLDYVAAVDARDAANLSASQFVDYDGREFPGPQRLRYDLTLHLGSASARAGIRIIDMFALEALAGVSLSALDLEIRGSGISERDVGVGIGPKGGVRFTFTPHPVIDVYGQWELHLLEVIGSDGRNEVFLRGWEAGARLHMTSNLSLFGGWREWEYDESVRNESDIDLELNGPTFGVLVRF